MPIDEKTLKTMVSKATIVSLASTK